MQVLCGDQHAVLVAVDIQGQHDLALIATVIAVAVLDGKVKHMEIPKR